MSKITLESLGLEIEQYIKFQINNEVELLKNYIDNEIKKVVYNIETIPEFKLKKKEETKKANLKNLVSDYIRNNDATPLENYTYQKPLTQEETDCRLYNHGILQILKGMTGNERLIECSKIEDFGELENIKNLQGIEKLKELLIQLKIEKDISGLFNREFQFNNPMFKELQHLNAPINNK